jgi:hypothetical protein
MVIRLYLEDHLNVSGREFYKVYKEIEVCIYSEEEKPLRIAL